MRVPTPAASVVISCAFFSPTRLRHSMRCVLSLVLSRMVVTLGTAPVGVLYFLCPSTVARERALYGKRSIINVMC